MEITYRIASIDDRGVIMEFLLNQFRVHEPITHSLGATIEDVNEFYSDLRDNGLKGPYSVLAFHGPKLIGICLNGITDFRINGSRPKKETRLKNDYAEEIASGAYESPNANRLAVFIGVVEEGLAEELALYEELATSVRVFKIDVLGVHPEHVGQKIGTRLVKKALEIAESEQCDYVATCATARNSQNLFRNLRFKVINEVLFDEFQEKGVPVYRNLHDGGSGGQAMILKL